ncbi:ABC-2 family transporter protein [Clostridium bornimense]|uniref:ABC transporter permease n=1 Tax=Clostridium bornimense TaxID=1216932 RepID=UPI001C0F51A6|nr:ABC-2 family transporter protein [Clostridium bornimense]MBU5317329.1 ABC-2 family transporter protein [Clostridium bornimense]
MKKVSAYFKVANLSFQNQMEYKMNFLLSFAFKLIPFVINILVWLAVTSAGSFSMTQSEIITYYAISLITSNLIICSIQYEVSDDIRNGTINKYLIKPISYFGFQFMKDFSSRIIFIFLGIIPVILVLIALRNMIVFHFNFIFLVLYIVSLIIGYIINFLLSFLLSELSFYFTNVNVFFSTTDVMKNIVSGAIFPLALLPLGIQNILMYLPFSYIGYFPTVILLHQFTFEETLIKLFIGVIWCLLLAILCKMIWSKGISKYSSFGG